MNVPPVSGAEDLEAAAMVVGDNAAASRLRGEAAVVRAIEDAERVRDAMATLERAARQVHPRALPELALRLGRCYGWARRRLRRAERRALRAALREARREDEGPR